MLPTKLKNLIKSAPSLVKKYKEPILYIIFGAGTTAVDFCISFLLYRTELNIHAAHVIAWSVAVVFAYVTNKLFVFESRKRDAAVIAREFFSFSGSRVLTLLIQEAVVWALFDCLKINEYAVKIAASVIVIVLNYIISKLVVFRGGKAEKERNDRA